MIKVHLSNRLPIACTDEEETYTKVGGVPRRITAFTRVCVVRPHVARAVLEDGSVVVYHCLDNSRCVQYSAVQSLPYESVTVSYTCGCIA